MKPFKLTACSIGIGLLVLGLVTPATSVATVTCVTNKKTGSSSEVADCDACEDLLGGCCYYEAGDCCQRFAARLTPDQLGVVEDAAGFATLDLDVHGQHVSYTLHYVGLDGAQTGSHFHGPAGPGESADVLYTLPLGAKTAGSFNLAVVGNLPVADQITALQKHQWYVDVHSTAYPSGEIRGQLLPPAAVPVLGPWGSVGLAVGLLIATAVGRRLRVRRARGRTTA